MTDRDLIMEDAELIAAYLDRQLSAEEQGAFLQRLDAEAALYETFVDTVRFRDEQQRGPAPVVEPSRSRLLWALPAAVAALLAVALVLPFLLNPRGGLDTVAMARALVERPRLGAGLGQGWTEHRWRRTRGLTPIASEVDSAFRVGVYAIDLEVALRLGKLDDARVVTNGIIHELGNIDFSEPLKGNYQLLSERLDAGTDFEGLHKVIQQIELAAAEFLDIDHGYAFGKWTETGRLAVLSGNEDLLRSRALRRGLRTIREYEWTDEVNAELDSIGNAIEDRGADLDLPQLQESFTKIINES